MFEIRASEHFSRVAPLMFLCWVCSLSTSLSSHVVVQSPDFIAASVGDTIKLHCTRDLPIAYCYNSISWFKINSRSGKLSTIKATDAQLDEAKKTCTRTISNAQVQDSGLYYCTSLHEKMIFMSQGTRVIITGPGPLTPSVVLYTPVEEETDAPSVLLQCVVMDVVPSQIRVFWMVDEEERVGWTESGWAGQDDSASEYTRAQIRISAEEWMDCAIQCVVTYENKTLSQMLQRQTHSHSCTWLLYGGCGIAASTIAVSITVALCLRKEKRTAPVRRRGADEERKQRAQGRKDTLMIDGQMPSTISEVEYSCLKPESFTRQPRPHRPPLELS